MTYYHFNFFDNIKMNKLNKKYLGGEIISTHDILSLR
jgi:hypothetical protein